MTDGYWAQMGLLDDSEREISSQSSSIYVLYLPLDSLVEYKNYKIINNTVETAISTK